MAWTSLRLHPLRNTSKSKTPCAAANGGIALLFQSTRLVAAVAELGSFGTDEDCALIAGLSRLWTSEMVAYPQHLCQTIPQNVTKTAIQFHGRTGRLNTLWTNFAKTSQKSPAQPLKTLSKPARKRSNLLQDARDSSIALEEAYLRA
jgi:hypothetical protein